MSDAPLLRPSQLARFWALHPITVHEWIRAGRLPAVRTPGNQFRLRAADVRAFCAREKLPVPDFVLARTRRVVVAGGNEALARTLKQALRATGATLDHFVDPVAALVASVVAPPAAIALDAKTPNLFAERATRALCDAPLDPKPSIVVFDVASAAKCALFAKAGATHAVTRARRADLRRLLVEIAGAA
jgi:excisionase family DNA binding protein